jgi:hypothetical protein
MTYSNLIPESPQPRQQISYTSRIHRYKAFQCLRKFRTNKNTYNFTFAPISLGAISRGSTECAAATPDPCCSDGTADEDNVARDLDKLLSRLLIYAAAHRPEKGFTHGGLACAFSPFATTQQYTERVLGREIGLMLYHFANLLI